MDDSTLDDINEQSIAIIGMSGRFPGAKNTDEFWQNLKNGVESITFFSDQELIDAGIEADVLKESNYVKAKGVLDNVAEFDAAFFGLSPTEARITDPQQRLFLECAWEALENAGYDPKTYSGLIGVYGGVGTLDTYLFNNLFANHELRKMIGDFQIGLSNSTDSVCTRVSYKFNLRGPSVSIQTACSTSLVAVVMGYQSLLDYQCDIVLAGGASISLPQKSGYRYQEGMIFSPDGHCRAFDAKAGGTIGGSGAGIVVLKRLTDALDDGDTIHAIIRGAAINNDGALKVGYTAPSVVGQTQVITEALNLADVNPETIHYVETHGTGTPLGDPIEIAALTQAFRTKTDKKGYCAISCAKTNIGHLDAASGVSGLIKAVLALKHQFIPPLLHFETPNPKLDLANSPFYINTELSEWKTLELPRRAGVSSFGIGGTNAHVILEEAPYPKSKTQKSNRPGHLLLLSAKTDTALETATTQLVAHLKQHPELNLADVAYTYQVGRTALSQRRMLVCETLEEAVNALEKRDPKRILNQVLKTDKAPSVVFMFPGQGAQYVNMGLGLYQTESVFRQHVDRCAEWLKPHLGLDLRSVLYSSPLEKPATALFQTAITQPALFVIEYALAQLWQSWGIHPKSMIGHSIGEYVAACLAGVFSLEEALRLVATRGKLIQSLPAGAMLAVPLAEKAIQPLLNQNLDLAALNAASQSIVSGTCEAVEQFAAQLAEQGIECQRLHTSHAFHSEMMSPILNTFLEQVETLSLKSPKIPFISNVSGTWISDREATDPHYWVKHLRQTVHFDAGLHAIFQTPSQIMLEVGPGRTLSTLAKRHLDNSGQVVLTSLRHPKEEQSDPAFLLTTLGQLWLAGIQVDWSAFHANEHRYRLPLPTYPFERQRYWIDTQKPIQENKPEEESVITGSSELWKSLIEATDKQAQQGLAVFDNPAYAEKYQALNRLSAAYVNLALRQLGAFSDPSQQYSADDLLKQFSILPFYKQLLPRCLNALVEQGYLQRQGEEFSQLIPLSRDEVDELLKAVKTKWTTAPELVELVELCGEKFAPILTGQENPRELLFTGRGFEALQRLYQSSPESQYFGRLQQASIKQIVKSLSPEKQLRILEIGGGMGATTAYLLPELPQQKTHYVFTDVGPSFLNQAKQKFSEYPYLEYRLLDIEQNPTAQGYENHRFDIIIAAQVLHVTKNLGEALKHVRSLLAPGGFLLLWEATRTDLLYFDIYLPILHPFEEADTLRHSDYPVLTKQEWYDALKQYGFVEVASFPKNHDDWEAHFLIAKASPTATVATLPAFTETIQQKTFHTLKKQADIADWFYIPSWKRSSLLPQNHDKENQGHSQHNCLIFLDEYGLGSEIVKQLEQEEQNVITVSVGPKWASHDERTYSLNPEHSEDYETLIKTLHARNTIPKTIVHCWRITPQNAIQLGLEELDKNQFLGFYSLFFLAQALGKQNITDSIQMNIVSNNMQKVTGHEVLCPEKATLIGPCRVIPQEYSNINCRSIDIVFEESRTSPSLLESLLSECVAESSDAMIAYRNNERWVQTFKPIELNDPTAEQSHLRKQGVYLITGGLGGIGLVLAEYLAKTVQAKLILITHSFFPEKEIWKTWLKNHNEQNSISRKITKIQAIEAMGAEVLVINADVANYEQMSYAISQSVKQFAQIHGVIQAAGVYPGGMIQSKTPAMAKTLMEPKVKGTLVLDAVLKDQPLDFMILCSSLGAIIGGTGLVDHCGANAFLDAFAHSKTSKDKPFTVSINWDSWQEIGQAAEEVEKQQKIIATGETPSERQYKKVTHPLFDECLLEGPDKAIYISRFSLSKYWFLDEHRFMGKPTLPGTAYLEMARAAFDNYAQRDDKTPVEFNNVYFMAPLTIEQDEEKEVQTILQKEKKGAIEFVISSQSKSGVWQEHARGQIANNGDLKSQTVYDIQVLAQKCQKLGQPKIQKGLELGARWTNLRQQIKFGTHQGLALIELPESFATDFMEYQLHPALLDAATGFSQANHEGVYLPFSYHRLRIENKLPAKIYSYIKFEEQNSASKTLKFDIEIMDEQGRRVLEIENYTLRKMNADLETAKKEAIVSECDNFHLEMSSPGLLDSLIFKPAKRQKPDTGEVEIEISATGLNFKEVLLALGILPVQSDKPIRFGSECAGHIVAIGKDVEDFQIGDEVIAFVKDAGCFSAYKTTSVSSVVPKPDSLTFEEAATLPAAFMTAYHALHYLARLSQGERVLIHAAAGGVGLAAVKIAQMIGAEIFATAGNSEKRAFLHGLGIEHVMDSRTLDFADEIMKCTEGRGVDVVLNSLGGIEFISSSLSLLAHGGRFLELGKRDIYENRALNLLPFQKGLSFFAIDVDHDSAYFRSLFIEIMPYFKEGKLSPLPYKIFPITQVTDAFKYMAKAKHIGKIVVSLQDKETLLKRFSNQVLINTDDSKNNHKQNVTFQHDETVLANINQYKDNIGLKEWLLPTEGLEAFKRILNTTHSQVAVSTRRLQARLEQDTILSFLKESASARLSGDGQSQFKQEFINATSTPHNKLEEAIVEVWQKFFGIKSISIFDDFFDLGGDSLIAVQLVAELRRRIQIEELSAHSLLENRTIAALVKSIQSVENIKGDVDLQSLPDSLVTIQAGKALRQPIFLVHPIGGQIYIYHDLARSLESEQPVYAFKAKGVDGEAQALTQIEDMATHYIKALRIIQPEGPYILGGHSFGGLVAFEMAQQLSTLGEEIALLFMMDTVAPAQVLIGKNDLDDVRVIAYALGLDINIDFPLPSKQFNQLPLEEKIRYFYEQSDMASQTYPSNEFIFHTRHLINVIKANTQAMNQYVPKNYQGKILFFRAQERDQFLPSNPEHSWIQLATEGIAIHDIPGNHISMNLSPNVEITANLLKASLQ